jgi:hypothetical protein
LNATAGGWTLGGKLYLYSGAALFGNQQSDPVELSREGPYQQFPWLYIDPGRYVNPTIIGSHCGKAAVQAACITPNDFAPAVTATNPNRQCDFGNSPPNSFRGPNFFSIATQLSKSVRMTEQTHFELGADAYNLLNHTNLAVPNSNLGASGFGLITSTVSSPTSIYGTGQGAIVSGRVLVIFGKSLF